MGKNIINGLPGKYVDPESHMFQRECDTEEYHLAKSGNIVDSLIPGP